MIIPKPSHPCRILIAVDGSDHSRAAVDLLSDLSLTPDVEIQVLSVVPQHHAHERPALTAELERAKNQLLSHGAAVTADLLEGHPAEVLTQSAGKNKCDLIVLGAKGVRSALGIPLGGVAQQVVEYSACPVLVVRAPYTGLDQVLLVTDGSETAQRAVDYLSRFCLPAGAHVKVMHVLPALVTPEYLVRSWSAGSGGAILSPAMDDIVEDINAWQAREEENAKKLLSQTVHTLKLAGKPAGSVLVRGDAASCIIDYARAHQVQLIVAGSRGLSSVRGWLMGSVSRKLTYYAPCCVLIVKGKED